MCSLLMSCFEAGGMAQIYAYVVSKHPFQSQYWHGHTTNVLSPKKWMSSYVFSTNCKQYVLSHPCTSQQSVSLAASNRLKQALEVSLTCGKTSKLICPPMENDNLKLANRSRNCVTICFLHYSTAMSVTDSVPAEPTHSI